MSPSTTKRILVAEDNDAMRALLAAVLQKGGFQVDQAHTGEELIEKLCAVEGTDELPDAIVSDLVMPGMNGMDALLVARAIAPQVPFVLITAFGDRQTHQRASNLGARAVLDKPFDLDVLRAVVRDAADNHARPPLPAYLTV